MISMTRLLNLGFALLCASCAARPGGKGPQPTATQGKWHIHYSKVSLPDELFGLSGIGQAGGTFWAVGERQRQLAILRVDETRLELERRTPLQGVPDGLDTEGLAVIEAGEGLGAAPDGARGPVFVFATEAHTPERASDALLLAAPSGSGVTVFDRLALPYSLWGGFRAERNGGIEGLCTLAANNAGAELVAAVETVGKHAGRRFAPVARYQAGKQRWHGYRLWLTTSRGKLSSVACRRSSRGGVEMLAIERDDGIARLLAFSLPTATDTVQNIEPEVVVDLESYARHWINLEGIGWLNSGALFLLADNHSNGRLTGPTEALILRPDAL